MYSVWVENNLFDETDFFFYLATGDGIETLGEVTTVKVRNGTKFHFY